MTIENVKGLEGKSFYKNKTGMVVKVLGVSDSLDMEDGQSFEPVVCFQAVDSCRRNYAVLSRFTELFEECEAPSILSDIKSLYDKASKEPAKVKFNKTIDVIKSNAAKGKKSVYINNVSPHISKAWVDLLEQEGFKVKHVVNGDYIVTGWSE